MGKLKVCEGFNSIQGEGKYIGQQMTFIRLAGCNKQCPWCDTKYALEGGSEYTVKELLEFCWGNNVCITGGEPLLQDINGLVAYMNAMGKKVHIETNGTLDISRDIRMYAKCITISPKLSNSGSGPTPNMGTIRDCITRCDSTKVQLKFVIDDSKDLDEALDWLFILNTEVELKDLTIILQPMAFKTRSLLGYMGSLRKLASYELPGLDIRVLPQLHRLLWPFKRGK